MAALGDLRPVREQRDLIPIDLEETAVDTHGDVLVFAVDSHSPRRQGRHRRLMVGEHAHLTLGCAGQNEVGPARPDHGFRGNDVDGEELARHQPDSNPFALAIAPSAPPTM